MDKIVRWEVIVQYRTPAIVFEVFTDQKSEKTGSIIIIDGEID